MSRLTEGDRRRVQEALSGMKSPARLIFFTQTIGCETCLPTRQIIDEIVPLSDELTFEEYNLVLDVEKAREYGIDKAPAIAVVGEQDTGIRFIGEPAGYEFASLINAILLVSVGDSALSEESQGLVREVKTPVHIQVFVTPT